MQGHTVTLLSDLFEYTHQTSTESHSCHNQSSEPESSQSVDCDDCFHIHTCCHIKVVQSPLKYDLRAPFRVSQYLEYLNLLISHPFIDGPFQPPKTI